MKVRWTRPALADLGHAHEYVARENPAAAAGLALHLRKAAAMLGRHPQLGRAGRVEGTQELVVAGTSFILVYRVKNGSVELLSLIHGARKWPDAI